VSNSVTVKIRAIEKTGEIIDAVADAGGDLTRINGITFTVENPAEAQKQAREKAMTDAKAKAAQLASLGGVKLGSPTYINENTYYAPYPVSMAAGEFARDSAVKTPISPGENEITVSVQVTFAIE
jgi:uncharacterized protein YggE